MSTSQSIQKDPCTCSRCKILKKLADIEYDDDDDDEVCIPVGCRCVRCKYLIRFEELSDSDFED